MRTLSLRSMKNTLDTMDVSLLRNTCRSPNKIQNLYFIVPVLRGRQQKLIALGEDSRQLENSQGESRSETLGSLCLPVALAEWY